MALLAQAHIALGTNQAWEDVAGPSLLRRSLAAIAGADFTVLARSSIWRSPAWPPGALQPDYCNAVIEVGHPPSATPQDLYRALAAIEARFGRLRRERWAPRTLDLDILTMGESVGQFGDVILPHPRMHERAFVLAPLAELAGGWRHPTLGLSAADLLGRLAPEACRKIADF